ncbi:DUF1433 domain-containing protein [Streptococcus didelphis]|uniref:DUF1433 domain-containing protein n=1 Tax=Streptococcus didelphis TaxID=102886 RepID=A0ABY9LHD5_9STRE|nr:hypothetical protein [Streptococcus didelphis]WMB27570.1 DUF1433 domain-containing protein [Streptococcus didelphis]WMB29462.1 DUF1433 domain-containing protein [Streptococcus didelphis]
MKKKILSCIVIMILLIGGGFAMKSIFNGQEMIESKNKQTSEINVKKEEKRMAEYVNNHYKGIKKIEFMNFDKNSSTGTWLSDAKINNLYMVTFNLFGEEGDIEIDEHISKSNGKELQLKKQTTNDNNPKIEIIYSEEVKNDN